MWETRVNNDSDLLDPVKDKYFARLSSLSTVELIFIALYTTDKNACEEQHINIIKKRHLLKRLSLLLEGVDFPYEFRAIKDYLIKHDV